MTGSNLTISAAPVDASPGLLHTQYEGVGLEGGHVLVLLAPSYLTARWRIGRPGRAQACGSTIGGHVAELEVGQLAGGGAAHGPLVHLRDADGGSVLHARGQEGNLRGLLGRVSGVKRVCTSERYASQPSGPYRGIAAAAPAAAARHLPSLSDDIARGLAVSPV